MRLELSPLNPPAVCGLHAPKVCSSCLGPPPSNCPLRPWHLLLRLLGLFRPEGHMGSQLLLVLGSCNISCWFPKRC